MTDPTHPRLQDLETLILASGEFGAAVTERLAPLVRATVHDIGHGTHPSMWPHADLIVLATSPERPRVAEAVDATAFVRGIPWLPVVARATEVQVGPVVVPGSTPCHRCHLRRREQHGVSAVDLDGAPGAATTGFARHHISIATALVRQAVHEACEALAAAAPPAASTTVGAPDAGPASEVGTVRRFNLVSGHLTRATVTAVDGCPRCRGRFGSREEFRQGMWAQLESALPQDASAQPVLAGAGR